GTPKGSGSDAPALPGSGLSTLIVEDHASTRWLFAEVLRSRGHEVATAADAEPAWQAFSERAFSIVMLDLSLPGGTGVDLFRRMRHHAHGADAVFMIVTGDRDPLTLQATL